MIEYYEAMGSKSNYRSFVDSYPVGMDVDRIIPILLNISQVEVLKKEFLALVKSQNLLHIPYMFRVGVEFKEENVHYLLTTMWALKKDRKLLKEYNRDKPIIDSWVCGRDKQEIIKKKCKLVEYKGNDEVKSSYFPNKLILKNSILALKLWSDKEFKRRETNDV